MRIRARQAQRSVYPARRLRVAVSPQPVPAKLRAQREGELRSTLTHRPSECSVKVLDLRVEPSQVLLRARSPERPLTSVLVGHREEVLVVALTGGSGLGRGREALASIRADGFEHRQPRLAVARLAAHEQALGNEPVEGLETRARDRFGSLDRRTTGEDGEAREARPLVLVE